MPVVMGMRRIEARTTKRLGLRGDSGGRIGWGVGFQRGTYKGWC